MYMGISTETSLFFIEDNTLVNQFIEISQKMDTYIEELNDGGVNRNDVWIIAFNIWLMLQPDELNIIESAEKSLYYSSNFIIFNAIKNDYYFKYIRSNNIKKSELIYLTSVFIADALNQWIAEIMKNENMTDTLKRNQIRSYFTAHLGTDEEVKQFLKDQAKFVKAIIPIISTTKQIERMIKNSYDQASSIYEKEQFALSGNCP